MTVTMQIDATRTNNSDEQIALALHNVASDAAILRLKVQALRWDYAGPHRRAVDDLLADREGELTRLFTAVASRLCALGHAVPGGPGAYRKNGSISFEDVASDQETRLRQLRDDLVGLIAACRTLHTVAFSVDARTADRLAAQIRGLEKGVWMLSAQIAGN
jgi:DNA-binding ferritin-like protein